MVICKLQNRFNVINRQILVDYNKLFQFQFSGLFRNCVERRTFKWKFVPEFGITWSKWYSCVLFNADSRTEVWKKTCFTSILYYVRNLFYTDETKAVRYVYDKSNNREMTSKYSGKFKSREYFRQHFRACAISKIILEVSGNFRKCLEGWRHL